MEGDEPAARADVDLGDVGGDAVVLDLDEPGSGWRLGRQRAEAVDHLGGEGVDLPRWSSSSLRRR